MATKQHILQSVDAWLNEVVIGLNLCPFAKKPYVSKQIRTFIDESSSENELLETLYYEFKHLEQTDSQQLETTLVVIPNLLSDFYDYNQFLDEVDALIKNNDWLGIFQVASFHPQYQFAGTQPNDAENLTNKAPYPIIHLLREQSMEKALERYPNPERIPEDNIHSVTQLSNKQVQQLFPYLFK